jgi:hypothetical protein
MENNWFQNPWATNQWMPGGAEFEKWAAPISNLDDVNVPDTNNVDDDELPYDASAKIKHPNVFIDLIEKKNLESLRQRTDDYNYAAWSVFCAKNIAQGLEDVKKRYVKDQIVKGKTEKVADKSIIQNLILRTHGVFDGGFFKGFRNDADDKTNKSLLTLANINTVSNATKDEEKDNQQQAKELQELLGYVKQNGRFILAACSVSVGNASARYNTALWLLSKQRLEIITPKGYCTGNLTDFTGNIKIHDLELV